MSSPLVWSTVAPLAAALAAFLAPGRARAVGLAGSAVTAAAAAAVGRDVWTHGATAYAVGGWDAPLGIELGADGLSALMLGMTALVGLGVSAYAAGAFAGRDAAAFWPLWLLVWGALDALYLSRDVFNVYVGLELLTLGAVALVLLARGADALAAALRYLLAALAGSLAYLLAVALLYGGFGVLSFSGLAERVEPGVVAWTAAARATAGLALKTALFPLHFWLPGAHSQAPAAVSAVLSALVVKVSFYLLVRLWFEVLAEAVTTAAAQLVGALAAAAIVWGSVQAIRQTRLKLLVAYSTVAQLGYLFLVFPLATGAAAGPWQYEAWSGASYHALAHATAKAAMFLAAGNIIYAYGTDRIADLGGVAERLPLSLYAFGLAGVSLTGMPPSAGFVAKWLLLKSAVGSGAWLVAVVILLGGFLAAGYVFVVLRQAFRPAADVEPRPPGRAAPLRLELPAIALAAASLALGVRAKEPLRLLEIGTEFLFSAGPGGIY